MELMGLNLIDCQLRLRGVSGSQPCISMNLLMNSVGNRFFGVGVVKGHGFVIFFAVGGNVCGQVYSYYYCRLLPK